MRRPSPLDRLLKLLMGASLALGIGVPALSFANGTLTPHEGCAVILAVDGDTVRLLCPAEGFVAARLIGFDTPEVFSPACPGELARGLAATAWLTLALWRAGHIAEAGEERDRYGRRLVRLRLDGRDVAGPMIALGLARPYAGGRRQGWCT
ncbi:thermonuclease family protein [Albidovulum sp.]|uniref:thermonuclease family protein n=1 Tax=Albidovulum sp. TaxID=1872424 RepID=UPI0039B8C351